MGTDARGRLRKKRMEITITKIRDKRAVLQTKRIIPTTFFRDDFVKCQHLRGEVL